MDKNLYNMVINRVWAIPSSNTISIPPIAELVNNQLARFRGRGSNPLSNINQKHLRFQLMSVHMSYMIPMEISHAWFVRTNPYSLKGILFNAI